MDEQTNPYSDAITKLKREREEIDALIAGLEKRGGMAHDAETPSEIHPDTFFGMGILDAAVQLLTMETRPQSAKNIATALKRGGLISESKNFGNTVTSILRREHEKGGRVITLPGRQWGLTERYRDAARKRAQRQGAAEPTPDEGEEGEDEKIIYGEDFSSPTVRAQLPAQSEIDAARSAS